MTLSRSSKCEERAALRIWENVKDLGYTARESWLLSLNGLTPEQQRDVWARAWAQIPKRGYADVAVEVLNGQKGFVRKRIKMTADRIKQARAAVLGIQQGHDSGASDKRAYKPVSRVASAVNNVVSEQVNNGSSEQPDDATAEEVEERFFAKVAILIERVIGETFSPGNQDDAWKVVRDYAADRLLGHRPDIGEHDHNDATPPSPKFPNLWKGKAA